MLFFSSRLREFNNLHFCREAQNTLNQGLITVTCSHETAPAVVHYLLGDAGVVNHGVCLHAAEAAVFPTVVQLFLYQRAA